VLDLYEEEYDPKYPMVCFDEKLVTLHADVRPPHPTAPGQPERIDYERLGTAHLFFMVEPTFGLAPCGDDGAAHQAGVC
jgi:hypothetical protein